MQRIEITDVWDDPSHGLTEDDFRLAPVARGSLQRSHYAAKLQVALDKGLLILPVHAIALGTLYGTPDGQPPVAANQMSDTLLLIAGTPGSDPWLVGICERGMIRKRVEVLVPGLGEGAPDAVTVRDEPFADVGNIAVQFTRGGRDVCKVSFGYWKRSRGKPEAQAAAAHLAEGFNQCRNRAGR
jgi:hypothetical protein